MKKLIFLLLVILASCEPEFRCKECTTYGGPFFLTNPPIVKTFPACDDETYLYWNDRIIDNTITRCR